MLVKGAIDVNNIQPPMINPWNGKLPCTDFLRKSSVPEGLSHKHLELCECILSTVDTDTPVLMHQAIRTYIAD